MSAPRPIAGSGGGRRGDPAALLRKVRILELVARRNVASLEAGSWATSIRGSGLIFQEPRKYLPGEPVRNIDWNVTARLREPYVKVHLEERRRDVFVAVDMSPSMRLGSRAKTKLETAVELAATLAASAEASGDRIGHVLFTDRVVDESRPRAGKAQLFRVLRALLQASETAGGGGGASDPRAAIHAVQRHRGRRFVVFLISDFIDHDVPDDIRYVQARHDVSLFHVYDPIELAPPAPLRFRGYSPEGAGEAVPITAGSLGSLDETVRDLRERCREHRLALTSVSTAEPLKAALSHFFHRKRRRTAR